MKKSHLHFSHRVCLLLILCVSLFTPALANEQDTVSPASNSYISTCDAKISANGKTITVTFSITAKEVVSSLGATSVFIKDSHGNTIASFYSSSTDDMMSSNSSYHYGKVTYSGATSGQQYYAVVNFKASNSSGSGTAKRTTDIITA